ncbi:hypothetical protein [Micromonospora sp. NPDC049240]|uniref:hypothetical protein n=1 Tax=Micromonospora sp. NPDC049240 TaxID=3155151 RepID=UPI0033DE027D
MTVTTLDGAAAGDQRGQEAVTNAANVLAQAPDGHRPAVDGHHRPRAPQMWEAGSASGAPGSYASTRQRRDGRPVCATLAPAQS